MKTKFLICLLIVFLFVLLQSDARLPQLQLPVVVPESQWRPLDGCVSEELESRLKARLELNKRWKTLIDTKKMAVGLVDLTNPTQPRFARINGNNMMYAASLPKIAVLLASVQALEDGRLTETPEIIEDMNRMIRHSSNAATTRMIDRVGFEKIEDVLTDPRYELYDIDRGGGLWVGKRYGKSGKRHPDPLRGLSHGATTTQVCRFYYLLATGKLITPARSKQMLAMLSTPGVHHKFVQTLEKRAPLARLYRKSGTWKNWHSDSVLVWGEEWRRYILVCLVEDASGEKILRALVPEVEAVLGH